jgi:hypothetical protein
LGCECENVSFQWIAFFDPKNLSIITKSHEWNWLCMCEFLYL